MPTASTRTARQGTSAATEAASFRRRPSRFTREEIAENLAEVTEQGAGGLSHVRGRNLEELQALADELAETGAARVQRAELHHSVWLFVLRAIANQRAGRSALGGTSEGFRAIADELFDQATIWLEKGTHKDLHDAVNTVLDEILIPEGVVKNIRNQSQRIYQGGAKNLLKRLESLTQLEVLDALELAHLRVFRDHPGLVADEAARQILASFAAIRHQLRSF